MLAIRSLIRILAVSESLGIGRSTVYKLLSEEKFPRPIRLGPMTVRWRLEEVETWRDEHETKPRT
jgi:prophage regulatory protein